MRKTLITVAAATTLAIGGLGFATTGASASSGLRTWNRVNPETGKVKTGLNIPGVGGTSLCSDLTGATIHSWGLFAGQPSSLASSSSSSCND